MCTPTHGSTDKHGMHSVYNAFVLMIVHMVAWPQGVQLERRYGSVRFAAVVAELLLLSHGLVLAISTLLATYIPEYR